jgi:hypothetical protein
MIALLSASWLFAPTGCDWHEPDADDGPADDGDTNDAGFVPADSGEPQDMMGDDTDDGPADDDGAGDEGEDLVCRPTFTASVSLIDHALCMVGVGDAAVPVAACGTSDSRLRPCDEAWLHYCDQEIGGDVEACDADEPRLRRTLDANAVYCSFTSPMVRACDAAFEDACDAVDFTYIAMNVDGFEGACVPPVEPVKCSATAKCPGGIDISCSVAGNGSCGEVSGAGGFVSCIAFPTPTDDDPSPDPITTVTPCPS